MCIFVYIHISLHTYLETKKKDTKIKMFSLSVVIGMIWIIMYFFPYFPRLADILYNKGKTPHVIIILFF